MCESAFSVEFYHHSGVPSGIFDIDENNTDPFTIDLDAKTLTIDTTDQNLDT